MNETEDRKRLLRNFGTAKESAGEKFARRFVNGFPYASGSLKSSTVSETMALVSMAENP